MNKEYKVKTGTEKPNDTGLEYPQSGKSLGGHIRLWPYPFPYPHPEPPESDPYKDCGIRIRL